MELIFLVINYIMVILTLTFTILDFNLIIFHFWLIKNNLTTFNYLIARWEREDAVGFLYFN